MIKNKPSLVTLTAEARTDIESVLQRYMTEELEVEASHLQLELLIDLLDQEVGRHYYNAGVVAAMNSMKEKTEDLVLLLKEK